MARQTGGAITLDQNEQEMAVKLLFFAASAQSDSTVLTAS
jgi:hypothetical protein